MRLIWDDRPYELGIDRGVFYPMTGAPEVWNGLISVTENTPDISNRVRYVEGRKVSSHRREDSFSATVSAFSHPSSFLHNVRIPFGLSYRIETDKGYKIHLVYNARAHISGRSYGQADNPEPVNFDISTVPMSIPEMAPAAHLVIDTGVSYPGAVAQFEEILYGVDAGADARLPTPDEVFDIFELNALFKIIDNGDGTFTMEAPDAYIGWLTSIKAKVNWPRVEYLNEDTYRIRSW